MTWTSIGAAAALVMATLAASASAQAGGSHRECRYSDYQGYHRHIGANDRAISCDDDRGRYHHESDRSSYGKRRLIIRPAYGYQTHSTRGSISCALDWHCERTGLFGFNKYCYWRQVCD